ncbi:MULTISPECIES: ABC transporter substrate-binding protein [unclassified Bradyrhizobium]|uniref:ABC transporter substrate-binding protein n=1 Tax=unclassified Bradyrhizobium TaxID=2631580 RepID=UPI00244CBC58|nr:MULTISPECIES: ABC transporter substrate-binding protein [unclassified Bradyrhizobium]MDH2346137.1 ABC transporter substrate-binding protein [Bradyrhizobium sp. SSUT77]MDH2350489.1 ABC transporter substrate-binding protein [Bradyrhizobium sp. SSUT112]
MLRLLATVALLAASALPAVAQVKIGVIASSTGPVSVVGVQQKNTAALLPKQIGALSVEYIYMDDSSDPTQSTKNVQKMLIEDKVDAIIGPSGSPNAVAVLPFIADAKTPMLAPVGSTAVILPMDDKKRWVFKTTQNDNLVMEAIVAHMKKNGVRTVAYIGTNDPLGESFGKAFKAALAPAGIKLVEDERFARTDTSVTGQTLKIGAASPDAVLIGTAGAATVLPESALVDQGYPGKIYQTHGAATPEFLKIGGKKVEGTFLAASPMLVMSEIGDDVPSQKIARAYIEAYRKLYNIEPGTFGANIYDAGLLLERAIPLAGRQAKPGTPEFRAALRDAIEGTKDLVGAQGVYNMTAQDHSGFDQRSIVMIVVKNGNWSLVK